MAASTNENKCIFLHHIDTFEINAIRKYLIEENLALNCIQYEIRGSLNQSENLSKVIHGRNPLDILNPTAHNFIQRVIECDVLIFNASSPNFENVCIQLREVLVALEKWTAEQKKLTEPNKSPEKKKYVLLISTPMTWALTENEPIEGDEDETIENFIYEDDYRRRKPHKSYCKHKLLERDVIWVQKKCQHFVKSLVVCPGVLYGDENKAFHYIFKLGFYNKIVPVLLPGSQNIPMIYIRDYAKIMKQLIDEFPETKIRYIFAVQPNMISLKMFTSNMCKSFNGDHSKLRFVEDIDLLTMEKELFAQSTIDLLSLDLKLIPSYLKDFPFQDMNDHFWDVLAEEFRDARNLHPLKIVIDGPPLVGKTEHARRLAEIYNLLYIDIQKVIHDYIKYLEEKIKDLVSVAEVFEFPKKTPVYESEDEDDFKPFNLATFQKMHKEDCLQASDMKDRFGKWAKELNRLKVYIASHKTFEEQDIEQISYCLTAMISTTQHDQNQGYIIDGFPFNYDQASQIYFNTPEPKVNEFTDSDPEPYTLRPTHVILFDATDELLCDRAMGLTETEAIMRRCLRHQMLPRLDAYRERNEEEQCLEDLFYDNDLIPLNVPVDSDTSITDTLRIIRDHIGHPFTYPLSSEQKKALDDALAKAKQEEEEKQRCEKEELIKQITLEREREISKWKARYEELQKHEHEMREVKTLPLRQYLAKYVLPTLTEGILKIAELKPDDPIDFLAEYLFKSNPEGQQIPPFCTEEQRQKFYDLFNDDLSSGSEYKVTDTRLNREECSENGPGKKQ